jgi:hypothetical protein
MKRFAFRVWIVVVFPLLPLWCFVGLALARAPDFWSEYWETLTGVARMAPRAFKKGGKIC